MKIIITENRLEKVLKKSGTDKTIQLLGGWENFRKVFKIESPMDFLHLFDDLEQVQSEKDKDLILFRYKPRHNLMIYDRKTKEVYISYIEIWSFLEYKFGLKYSEIQSLTTEWLDEAYNLRGVTTFSVNNLVNYFVG